LKSMEHATCLLRIVGECFRVADFIVGEALQLDVHGDRTVNVDAEVCRSAKHDCILQPHHTVSIHITAKVRKLKCMRLSPVTFRIPWSPSFPSLPLLCPFSPCFLSTLPPFSVLFFFSFCPFLSFAS